MANCKCSALKTKVGSGKPNTDMKIADVIKGN